jgi:CBS domain-containing protein
MITVRSIMQTHVVTIRPEASVRQLARLLADEEISGVPVVDGNCDLVGVVSSTDVVRLAAEEADVHMASFSLRPETSIPDPEVDEEPEPDPYGFFLPEDSPLGSGGLLSGLDESELDARTVADIMTPVTYSVEADATAMELAEFLVRGRIHRAVVVEEGCLRGIVTSGDILRAVADGRLS